MSIEAFAKVYVLEARVQKLALIPDTIWPFFSRLTSSEELLRLGYRSSVFVTFLSEIGCRCMLVLPGIADEAITLPVGDHSAPVPHQRA